MRCRIELAAVFMVLSGMVWGCGNETEVSHEDGGVGIEDSNDNNENNGIAGSLAADDPESSRPGDDGNAGPSEADDPESSHTGDDSNNANPSDEATPDEDSVDHDSGTRDISTDDSGNTGGTDGSTVASDQANDEDVQDTAPDDDCSDELSSQTFRYAVCSCNDTTLGGDVTIDGFDSVNGSAAGAGVSGGAVGANEALLLYTDSERVNGPGTVIAVVGMIPGNMDIGSNVTVAGAGGVTSDSWLTSSVRVRGDLRVQGPFIQSSGTTEVTGSAWLGSGLQGTGNVLIDGNVTVPDTAPAIPAFAKIAGDSLRGPVNVEKPCPCDDSEIIDVAAIIADGKVNNDNAVAGFDASRLSLSMAQTVELPARTFVTSITSTAQLALVINQKTSLFVEGDVSTMGAFSVTLGPQGELDLYIGGNLMLAGGQIIGDTDRPTKLRVYVADDRLVALSGGTTFSGYLYAPRATVMMAGAQTLYGALFAGDIELLGATVIHYDFPAFDCIADNP